MAVRFPFLLLLIDNLLFIMQPVDKRGFFFRGLLYISKSYGYQKNYGYPRLLLKKNMRIAANISAGRVRVLIHYLFRVETTHDNQLIFVPSRILFYQFSVFKGKDGSSSSLLPDNIVAQRGRLRRHDTLLAQR